MTIQIKEYAFLGRDITHAIDEAIDMARAGGEPAAFDFNGVVVTVDGTSHAGLIYRDWERAMDGKIAKAVGPRPAKQLSDDEIAADARVDAENAARRQAADELYLLEQNSRTAALEATLASAPAMTRNEDLWRAGVEAQKGEGYGIAVFAFAEDWARLMQARIELGENLSDIAEDCSRLADGKHGVTGFQYGCAVNALTQTWAYGDPLRRWHNKEYDREDAAGTINPAVLTLGESQ